MSVSVGIDAETNADVNAAVLAGNTITGPVNFNYAAEAEEKEREEQERIKLHTFLEDHKINMTEKAKHIFEGKKENKVNLEKVYTEVFMTEGDIEEVNCEHEILKIDVALKSKKSPIKCNDIFQSLGEKQCNDIFQSLGEKQCNDTFQSLGEKQCNDTFQSLGEKQCNDTFQSLGEKKCNDIFQSLGEKKQIILTKGIAGIGKTVYVQKFILDWAEEKASKIDAVFLFPFRQINQIKDKHNLHEFLQEFYPEMKKLDKTTLRNLTEKKNVVFIFDGLDESRLHLDFASRPLTSVDEKSSVNELITNLIRGDLLPSSLTWITSRPAAANQIPPEFVGLFTEMQGFTNQQKDEYFRKRFKDQADKMLKHIKRSRSIYIMCHSPVFCWITATVLHDIVIQKNKENIDTTLTEMYIHFLLIQMNMKNQKYDEGDEQDYTKLLESNKTTVLNLAKLAFEQLKKEKIIFYEKDLKQCGIVESKDSEYTGMIIEISKKESVLHKRKVFSFVHLSVQEFLAALHVFICYMNKNMKDLEFFFSREPSKNADLHEILQKATDKAKESERGHLDLFLRFLMGISLESSQKLLEGLLTHTEDTTKSIRETTEYIKELKDSEISDKAISNLYHCLLELKDQPVYGEIQRHLHPDSPDSVRDLSSNMCTLMICVLSMSEKVLEELNIKKRYRTSKENCERLIPAVNYCKKVVFDSCGLTERLCESLSSYLQLSDSPLRELDLSNNDLQDSGVKLISDALKSHNCQLEILRLSSCNLTDNCCESLSSYLQSPNSPLRELDLNYNDLQDSGVKLISDALKTQDCQLEILRLSGCMVTDEGCGYLDSALQSNPSHLKELDLSYNHPQRFQLHFQERYEKYGKPKYSMDHGGEFRIRKGPCKWVCDLTPDPTTAHNYFMLSDENRRITYGRNIQAYPGHPDRFNDVSQVLCRENLTGRCYWEVELSGSRVYIAVAYKSISRSETFGATEKSWILDCNDNSFAVWHKNDRTSIPAPSTLSNRVGVYVDVSTGSLSFYSVSDTHTLTHLHTFNTAFTEPLYAGFKVFHYGTSVYLCKVK